VSLDDPSLDPFLKLADRLGELEVTLGERARPVVAELRESLRGATALRQSGDLAGSLALLRSAMGRLTAMGCELDPAEGALMRMVAERFGQALEMGDKGTAKTTIKIMRQKAGDPNDEDNSSW
jgi:hypothetical protein